MYKIGAYVEALVAGMVEPGVYASERWGGYVLIAADATTVERPGAKGTTARVHYALHLSDLHPRFVRVTDEKVGETARNFDAAPGELWILDRGYSNPPSVLAIVERGADIAVRFNRHTLSVYDARGARIDVPKLLRRTRRRGRAQHEEVRVRTTDGREARAQLCWVRLPKREAEKARAKAARGGEKSAVELDVAEYVVVLCTAPTSRLSAEQVMELYRARWQVELEFKRDKSIGQLDTLPNLIPQTIHAWICAKILLGLIARRLSSQSVAIPPSGLATAILPVVELPARPCRRALVRDATGMEPHSQRASVPQVA